MGVAQYNAKFALKVRALTEDGMGTETEAVSTVEGYGAVPCTVQTLPASEQVIDEKIVHETLKKVFCHIPAGVVTTDHFLVIAGIDYEIIDIGTESPLMILIKKKV